ncbi:MAG: hypothetical protein HY228_00540 [Candidatus Yonathbacteria bacterium]|nr:hypothetical protein [Candidatus Yonathbacteria bacterium]
MTGQIATTFLSNDLVWWTGMIGGFFFLSLCITALIKQFNYRAFMKWQIPFTPLHHWFGWLALGFLFIHVLLAVFQFNFNVFF